LLGWASAISTPPLNASTAANGIASQRLRIRRNSLRNNTNLLTFVIEHARWRMPIAFSIARLAPPSLFL
jgi:hypothetical protein